SPTDSKDSAVSSPNGSAIVLVHGHQLRVEDRKAPSRFAGWVLPVETLAEVLWAPDSSAFALTESDGGSVGTWSTTVYRLDEALIRPARIDHDVLQDFRRHFPQCPDESPNVVAVGWSDGSASIRIVVQMPCHSSCSAMCAFRGYVINSESGKIEEQLDSMS